MEGGDDKPVIERFHELEKQCIGFENYINCDDKHYTETLEGLRQLVVEIQREHLFSENESLKEVDTNNIKYTYSLRD